MSTSLSRGAAAAAALAASLACGSAFAGSLGYSITGTASYTSGCGPGIDVGQCGSPDTAFLQITNTGPSAFTGTATLFGIAPGQTINLSIVGTLNPGQTWTFGAGPESSNMGGFNKVSGNPDNGLQFSMVGTLDGDPFSNSIYDKDIHSGVVRTNPFGVDVDSYVLQGGDPFGRDTGDAFEESQANGTFVWAARPVPEPGTWALMLGGLAGVGALARRRKA